MKILVLGPSDVKSRGGMSTVISDMRNSEILNKEYDISYFSTYISSNFIIKHLYCVFAYLKFLVIFKKYDIFHIHTASYGSTFRKRLYLKAIKKSGKKAIVHIHGAKYIVFYDGLNNRNKKKVVDFLNLADIVIALSDNWKEVFETKFGIKNCISIPNGIDLHQFDSASGDFEENKDHFILLGQLGKRKGAYDLVDAVQEAVKDVPAIKVYMAGDGDVEKIREMVIEKKLENNIDVVGWVDFQGKIDLLKKCSTMVLPSYNEGLPMAILEAMAAGKIIISSTVGAIPEVVKDENGFLITPGDVKALASAIIKCSRGGECFEQIAKNNKKKIEEKFSVKQMHTKISNAYKMLF